MAVFVAVLLLALIWWQADRPGTPEALFRERCTECHKLPDVCRFPPDKRPGIVATMRRVHGASGLIGDDEARAIADYLAQDLKCP